MSASQLRYAILVTDAAIGIAWLAGVILVVMGGWYVSSWWQIKIVFVLIISAIHTFMLRRWRAASAEGASTPTAIPYLLLFLSASAVLLVVLKKPV